MSSKSVLLVVSGVSHSTEGSSLGIRGMADVHSSEAGLLISMQ